MSITSVTIRLDIGDGNSSDMSHGISLQGELPSPKEFSTATETVFQGGVPTPSTNAALSAMQDNAPTPLSGIGDLTTSISEPPAPSHDLAGAVLLGLSDDEPKPEENPAGEKKGARKRR